MHESTTNNPRLDKALLIWRAGQVSPNGQVAVYYVASQSRDGLRHLAATPWSQPGVRCTCEGFEKRAKPCKHIYAASLAEAEKRIRARLAKGESLQVIETDLLHRAACGIPAEHETAWLAYWWATQELLGAR